MSQFGDSAGLKCGGLFFAWPTSAERERIIAGTGFARERSYAWHSSPRIPPMEWWPPIYFYANSARRMLVVRLWPVTVLSTAWYVWLRRPRGYPPPLCPRCGYDNGGEPRPCPECGFEKQPKTPPSKS